MEQVIFTESRSAGKTYMLNIDLLNQLIQRPAEKAYLVTRDIEKFSQRFSSQTGGGIELQFKPTEEKQCYEVSAFFKFICGPVTP